jgi:hypothetical protein
MIDAINGLMCCLDPTTMQKRQENFFNRLDSDGDGLIDQTEIQAFADRLSEKTGKDIDGNEILNAVDTNEDGFIDQEEFQAAKDKVKEIIGPPNPPNREAMMIGRKPDFTQLLLDMINREADEDNTSSTNEGEDQYNTLYNYFLQRYTNNASVLYGENNPLSILA